MADYVNLDRRFRDALRSGDSEAAALASYASSLLPSDDGLSWSDVLKHRLVVILGEPGSGKTAELRAQASLTDISAGYRFFVRLDDLVQGALVPALRADYSKKFDDWRRSKGEATFFLDSVDESKYRNSDDFIHALERLRGELGNTLPRAKFVISSRISEWRPLTDKDAVLNVFGLPGKTGEDESIKIFQIEPLDRSRVERYARDKGGLKNPQEFVSALDEQHAWCFARRPVDVVPLFNYWNAHQRLGTLMQLIEFSLKVSLGETESRERLDPLSLGKAREGAEALAAAATLCKQFNIAVPDWDFLSESGALSPAVCLPDDWQPPMRRALLARAIFDSATYGHIRFHHRDALDYLAASWLARLMNADCPLEALEDLLFQTKDKRKILRPSLVPLAAWLANGDEPWRAHLRDWIKQAAPWVFFQHGDGAGLPLEYRREILNAIVQHYAGRGRVMLDWSAEALSRMASPEMAGDINAIIRDASVSEDLKADMLSLARHGRLHGCVPIAVELVGSESASDSLRSYAAALVRDVGDVEDRRKLAGVVDKFSHLSTILSGRFVEALYPTALNATGLLDLLQRTDDVGRYSIDLPYCLREHLESHLTSALAPDMLNAMLRLLDMPPLNKDVGASTRFMWLANLLPVCLDRLLRKDELGKCDISSMTRAFAILEEAGRFSLLDSWNYRQPSKADELRKLLAQHPALRRVLFWSRIKRWKEQHGQYPVWYPPLEIGGTEIGLDSTDIEWLVADVSSHELSIEDRVLAAKFAIDVPGNSVTRLFRIKNLLQSSADSVFVRKEIWQELGTKLTRPFMSFWYRNVKHKLMARHWRNHKYRTAMRSYKHLREQCVLHRRCGWLRSGQRWDWLGHLIHEDHALLTQRSSTGWDGLEKRRGRRIAQAVRIGCETLWPQYIPLLPHEKPNRNSTDYRVFVGLAGLQSLWQRGALSFSALSDEDVQAKVSILLAFAIMHRNFGRSYLSS